MLKRRSPVSWVGNGIPGTFCACFTPQPVAFLREIPVQTSRLISEHNTISGEYLARYRSVLWLRLLRQGSLSCFHRSSKLRYLEIQAYSLCMWQDIIVSLILCNMALVKCGSTTLGLSVLNHDTVSLKTSSCASIHRGLKRHTLSSLFSLTL